jgi:hypothetical protein
MTNSFKERYRCLLILILSRCSSKNRKNLGMSISKIDQEEARPNVSGQAMDRCIDTEKFRSVFVL